MKKCISYFFGTEIPAQPWYVSGKRCFRYKTKRPRSRRSEIEDLSVRKWDLNGICVDQVLAAKTNRKELVTQTWNAPLSPLKINVFLSQNLLGRKIYLFSLNLEENKQHPFSFCYKYHKSICKVDPRPLGNLGSDLWNKYIPCWNIGGPTINDDDTNSIRAGQTGNQKLATYPKLRVLSCLFLFFFEPFKQIKYKLLRYWHKNYCDRDRLLSFLAVTKAGSKKVFGREHLRLNDHH